MRGLRIRIDKPNDLQYATLWITSCILLHSFAMEHEGGIDLSKDRFYLKGLRIMRKEARRREAEGIEEDRDEGGNEADDEVELLEGKIRRENLKKDLLAWLNNNE